MGRSTHKSAEGGLQLPKSGQLHRLEQQLWPHAFPKRNFSRQLLLRHLIFRRRLPQSNLTLLLPNVKLWPLAIDARSENRPSPTFGTCRRITTSTDRTTNLFSILPRFRNLKTPPAVHGILNSRLPPRRNGHLPPQRHRTLHASLSRIHLKPIPPFHGAPLQHNDQLQQPQFGHQRQPPYRQQLALVSPLSRRSPCRPIHPHDVHKAPAEWRGGSA